MTLNFEYLCRECDGAADVSRFLGCSSTLSGRELDENGKPVFRTLERFHESIVSGGPYVLGVLSDTLSKSWAAGAGTATSSRRSASVKEAVAAAGSTCTRRRP